MRVCSVMSVFRCGFLRGPLAALGLMMLFSAAVFAQQPEPCYRPNRPRNANADRHGPLRTLRFRAFEKFVPRFRQ